LFGLAPLSTIEGVMIGKRPDDVEGGAISRRQMLKGAGLLAGGALLGLGLTLAGARLKDDRGEMGERPWYELGIIGEPVMDNQLLWYLSHTGQGMADIDECLDPASRIDAADACSWPEEWPETAGRVREMAENSLARGHRRSAGHAYMRAAITSGQAKRLYDALNSPKEYMLLTEEDTGLVHCQTGALSVASQRTFDWLDENI